MGERFTKLDDQLIELGLPIRLVALYGRLRFHAGADGLCYLKHATLAREIRIQPRHVRKLIGQLQFFRLIRWKRGRYCNEYQVLDPDIAFLQRQTLQKRNVSADPDRASRPYLNSDPDRAYRPAQIGPTGPVTHKEGKEYRKEGTHPPTPHGRLDPKQPKLPGLRASDDARVSGASALAIIPRSGKGREGWFDAWWAIYWRKVAKKAAERAFKKNIKTEERFRLVMAATRAQTSMMMARDPDKRPHGATWINGARWDDEPSTPATARKPPERQASLVERTKALWAKRLAKGERPI